MAKPRITVSVPFNQDEYDALVKAAAKAGLPVSTYLRGLSAGDQVAIADRMIPDSSARRLMSPKTPTDDLPNPQGCPTGIGAAAPCQLPNHGEAEWRVENELAPAFRRKIAPRDAAEGPHEYIARFWGADELKRDFYLDLNKALGWIKDDDEPAYD